MIIYVKGKYMDIEGIFYNKQLCDAIRDIVKCSATSFDNAALYMKLSKDYKRDSFVIKKLSNAGIHSKQIYSVIKALNS